LSCSNVQNLRLSFQRATVGRERVDVMEGATM
jgi:hypothetical protein